WYERGQIFEHRLAHPEGKVITGRGESRLLTNTERALADSWHLEADMRGHAIDRHGLSGRTLRSVQGLQNRIGQHAVAIVAFVGGLAWRRRSNGVAPRRVLELSHHGLVRAVAAAEHFVGAGLAGVQNDEALFRGDLRLPVAPLVRPDAVLFDG